MWSKTRLGASNFIYEDSWEEEAFAKDAAGAHGGCVWPPRSYTCSFCRREFRSAQGLGGHMNVHRSDRARLKQFQDPRHAALPQMAHPNRTGYSSFLPQIRQSFLDPIPNSSLGATATVSSPSQVICQSSEGGSHEPEKFPPYFPTFLNDSRSRLLSRDHLFPSRSNWSDRNTSETNNKLPLNQKDDFGHESRSETTEPDFPMSLILATRTRSSSDKVDEDETVIFDTVWKRRQMDEPSLPFLLKRKLQAVVETDESSDLVEEALDLKLRLGERPKKKLLRS